VHLARGAETTLVVPAGERKARILAHMGIEAQIDGDLLGPSTELFVITPATTRVPIWSSSSGLGPIPARS
jgi:hypothetical protein